MNRGDKLEIIFKKIIPTLAISIIFAPVVVPCAFAFTDLYRHLGRWIREVHHGRKLKCINNVAGKAIKEMSRSGSHADMRAGSQTDVEESQKSKALKKLDDLTGINQLPPEVLNLVLSNSKPFNGNYKEQLFNFSLVSKEWKESIEKIKVSFLNQGILSLNDLPGIKTKNQALNYIEQSKNLRFIKIKDLPFKNYISADEVLNICPNIKVLDKKIVDADLADLTKIPELTSLDLSYCSNITDEGLTKLATLPNLIFLDVSFCLKITDNGLKELIKIQNLMSLNISCCLGITEDCIKELIKIQSLEALSLSGLDIKNKTLKLLAHLPNLTFLDLSACFKITDKEIKKFAKKHNNINIISTTI